MEPFKVIGYYICETAASPEWLRGVSHRVLSVSGCIGEQHPRWECFLGGFRKGEDREYQKKLQMDNARYEEFSQAVNRLFTLRQIDLDSRFLRLSDARGLYQKFFSALPCRLVSVSTTPEYFDILAEEQKNGSGVCPMSGTPDNGPWLGGDILGWDISGFHSFLCNSLQKELPDAAFNEIGLLENSFPDVVRFAKRIEGQGEPVVWIPCRIGQCE